MDRPMWTTGHMYKYINKQSQSLAFLYPSFWSFDKMNRFHLYSLFAALLLLLVFSPTHAIPRASSSPSARTQRVFHPSNAPLSRSQARDFQSQKRKVPTGSNPLHNKRRWSIATPSSDNLLCLLYSSFDLESSIIMIIPS